MRRFLGAQDPVYPAVVDLGEVFQVLEENFTMQCMTLSLKLMR